VAACPSGAIHGNHFSDDQIEGELEGLLEGWNIVA
jgi:heterodisulfide reductase subunit A-like polyferredoxin